MVKTHGMSKTNIYRVWQAIKSRCTNPNMSRYKYYMDKGVSYPEKWETFEGFYEDMGESYKEGLTTDRIDGNKDYSKENCRWANYVTQNNNKTNNIILNYKGQKLTIKEASKRTGLLLTTIYKRMERGWSNEKILNTPPLKRYINKRYENNLEVLNI